MCECDTFDGVVDEVVEGRQRVAGGGEVCSGGLESTIGRDLEGEVDVRALGSAEAEEDGAGRAGGDGGCEGGAMNTARGAHL
jgi:hypothetical protein